MNNPLRLSTDKLHNQVKKTLGELELLARQNLAEALISNHYTGPQKMAMLYFEMLDLATDLDLVPLLARGELIQKIARMSLWTQLPGAYGSLEEALEERGHLSRTEQANIRGLTETVFPYIEKHLGMSISEFWNKARSKSNIYEIVPYLKVAITGELSSRESVNEAVARIMEEVDTDDQRALVSAIIEMAATETNKSLRRILRPKQSIPALVLHRNGTKYLVAEMNQDDLDRVSSSDMFDIQQNVNLLEYEPTRVPAVRRLLGGEDGRE